MKSLTAFSIAIGLLLVTLPSIAKEISIEDYQIAFSGDDLPSQALMTESLAWAGISQADFYDLIEQTLLKNYQQSLDDISIDNLSWLAKGLGFSGNPKYLPTLQKLLSDAKSRKLKKYAGQAIDLNAKYQEWNPIINPQSDGVYPSRNQRLINMLDSGNLSLMHIAAKRIHYKRYYEQDMTNALVASILKFYNVADTRYELTIMRYMMKVLSKQHKPETIAIFAEIKNGAENAIIRKLARKLERYVRSETA